MGKASRRKTPASSPGSSGASTPNSANSGPIPPFSKIPTILNPFVEKLSTDEVYLIHIDTTATDLKWQTFLVPSVVNVVVAAVIALRVYWGFSTYPALIAIFLGMESSLSFDTSTASWFEIAQAIFRRTGTIFIDYFLVTLFLSWPFHFVTGPVRWRRAVGFRDREIIVRRSSRSWSRKLERNKWIRHDEAMRDKIVAAVTPERIGKTGYLLVDDDWNLDYQAMIRAHALVDLTRKGDGVQLDEFRTAVLVHTDSDGWLVWRVADENTPAGRERNAHRDQVLAFKDKLTALGKESLFYRWVELVQWESSQPGGFTPERQQSAMVQVQQMFEQENISFSDFWDDLGGMQGLEMPQQ
ncbi:uncharacterized protein N7469_004390 [Penicillium citrinum]|uniref:Uncharacterized protein n=2 Tax=Penicillium TaxID=5073 RepID=A0A9W9TQQ7_PENCI|nr:uncharacterized protein N7469_004390 [Penicillium citrinum]KAJ5235222.1 hypothetical protein N7469_004390 [Penicillium citrinum]KAK5800332.1 hypothetical protein VI817_002544 [Penicillium citrinum]